MIPSRRQLIQHALFGAGLLGLRSLATGLPISLLARPREALAEETPPVCADKAAAQYLILSTSEAGDPLNANVPGAYDFPEIAHPLDPLMAKTALTVGGKATFAAKPWANLGPLLARTSFVHHATLTGSHNNEAKVLRLMGATERSEMSVSIFSRYLATCLGTVQSQPISLGAVSPGESLTYEGRTLPPLTPTGLKATLLNPKGPLTDLQKLRDADLDRLNALFKESGTTVQRQYLDRMATTQREARAISQELLDSLNTITANDANNQIIAAATLIKMNVSPVVSLHIGFGGDNHADPNLQGEATQTVAGCATIAALMQKLAAFGLQDKVTFAAMNVFGRTLSLKGTTGRDHLGNHHCTVMMGKNVKGSLIGGLTPNQGGADFKALPIDSMTGAGSPTGDIAFTDTLASTGKTLGAALGVPQAILDQRITSGKIIRAALV